MYWKKTSCQPCRDPVSRRPFCSGTNEKNEFFVEKNCGSREGSRHPEPVNSAKELEPNKATIDARFCLNEQSGTPEGVVEGDGVNHVLVPLQWQQFVTCETFQLLFFPGLGVLKLNTWLVKNPPPRSYTTPWGVQKIEGWVIPPPPLYEPPLGSWTPQESYIGRGAAHIKQKSQRYFPTVQKAEGSHMGELDKRGGHGGGQFPGSWSHVFRIVKNQKPRNFSNETCRRHFVQLNLPEKK